jgi:hypothetical protein
VIVLGEVDPEGCVSYSGVTVWNFTGIEIAHLDLGNPIEWLDTELRFIPDPDLKNAQYTKRKQLDRFLRGMRGREGVTEVRVAVGDEKMKVRLLPLPTDITLLNEAMELEWPNPPKCRDIIRVVVTFQNHTDGKWKGSLYLPEVEHLHVPWDEAYGDFENRIKTLPIEEYDSFDEQLEEVLNFKWELMIHVLPQIQFESTMYPWHMYPEKSLNGFLDHELQDEYGRKLYIVVSIQKTEGEEEAIVFSKKTGHGRKVETDGPADPIQTRREAVK